MPKVLKITKSDRTIHTAPIGNKSFYQFLNAKIHSASDQWKIEEIDEKDVDKLTFIDETYVTAKEAQNKVPELQDEITRLKAELEKLRDPGSASRPYAAEPPMTEKESAENFTEHVKSHPEENEAETNATIAHKESREHKSKK